MRGVVFPGFGVVRGIWRGWIVPVGGLTPDRLKVGSDWLGPA